MMKKVWWQIHWALGITTGVVLAIMGVTGALLSFEHELLRGLNPGIMTVMPNGKEPLPLSELVAQAQALFPDKRLTGVQLSANPRDAVRIGFASSTGVQGGRGQAAGPASSRRPEWRYIDPYTGALLDEPRGQGFFRFVTELHRRLAGGETGKAITGVSTLALIVLSLSGLYLRWPRKLWNWRTWFTFNFALTGRSFLWHLHTIVGTWVLVFYLLAGLTGLFWSYDWYRNGLFALTGAQPPNREEMLLDAPTSVPPDLTAVWATFVREVGTFHSANINLPQKPTQALEIRYLSAHPPHERAFNQLAVHPVNGEVLRHDRYAERTWRTKLINGMFVLHSGSFFGLPGLVLMMVASLIMPLFAITGWQLYLDRRAKKRISSQDSQFSRSFNSPHSVSPSQRERNAMH